MAKDKKIHLAAWQQANLDKAIAEYLEIYQEIEGELEKTEIIQIYRDMKNAIGMLAGDAYKARQKVIDLMDEYKVSEYAFKNALKETLEMKLIQINKYKRVVAGLEEIKEVIHDKIALSKKTLQEMRGVDQKEMKDDVEFYTKMLRAIEDINNEIISNKQQQTKPEITHGQSALSSLQGLKEGVERKKNRWAIITKLYNSLVMNIMGTRKLTKKLHEIQNMEK